MLIFRWNNADDQSKETSRGIQRLRASLCSSADIFFFKQCLFLPPFFSLTSSSSPRVNLLSNPSFVSDEQDFCYESRCVFSLAPRSVSSVPLLHYRSTAPLSPTLKGMQTHIKRGPLIFKISRLCSAYVLPSYLSVPASRVLVGPHLCQRVHAHSESVRARRDAHRRLRPALLTWQTLGRWISEVCCPAATCTPLSSGF